MLKGIDHVVIAVADLERAVAGFSELGFTVVRGGRHPALATHNALIAFADGAYFELIAFQAEYSPHPWFNAVRRGGGLTDFCMQTDDLDADVAALRRAGAHIGEPLAMERERPDGYTLKWVLAVAQPPSAGSVPFLIRDLTPRDERVPRARSHLNGAAAIRTLTVAVRDARAAGAFYASVLGTRHRAIRRDDLGAAGVSVAAGPHELQLVEPATGHGIVARWIRGRGPSPVEVTLRGRSPRPTLLDPARAQGARIRL
ncbi:MAG TPA: VOC family protein [Candidatus Binataceae bacterium]|nr:VOC family protein [Candidatus Binataceae bacterium]